MYRDEDLLPLSGLQHMAYCERQWALIHLEQQWAESIDTVRGSSFHERVDMKGYTTARGFRAERCVRVASFRLGLYGVADIVEYGRIEGREAIRPVEYKVGKPKVEDWDRIQLAAQALCLEEMCGVSIAQGCLYYGETRHRERIVIDDVLRKRVEELSSRIHSLFETGTTPGAFWSAKCRRCSLQSLCAPAALQKSVQSYWSDAGIDFPRSRHEKALEHAVRDESRGVRVQER